MSGEHCAHTAAAWFKPLVRNITKVLVAEYEWLIDTDCVVTMSM